MAFQMQNRRYRHQDITCKFCKNVKFDQKHLMECKYLIGQSEIVSSIPNYNDLFNGKLEEQMYISRILKEHFRKLTA